jgi:hypothetical protein
VVRWTETLSFPFAGCRSPAANRWLPIASQYSGLGIRRTFSYAARVIGFLRFVGILNAAVWFGTAIFFSSGVGVAPFSSEMKSLLGENNYPYFSGAIAQILIARYFHFQVACGVVAVLHLLAEWLYLGKSAQKFQVGLLIGLCSAALLGGFWLQPKLKALHAIKYGANNRPEIRQAADRSFKAWHGVSQVVNLLVVGGLALYLWRAANPSDPTRFVRALKFTMR